MLLTIYLSLHLQTFQVRGAMKKSIIILTLTPHFQVSYENIHMHISHQAIQFMK